MSDDSANIGAIRVEHVGAVMQNNQAVEKAVDADISVFEQYFQSLGNESLMGVERAIIKTYLHFKLLGPRT